MKKKKDYVPTKDKDFFDWQDNLVAKVVLNAVLWLIATGKVTALQTAQTIYLPLYNAIKVKTTRTQQQVDAHQVGRKIYVKFLRTFVKENLVASTSIPHDDKVAMGLNPLSGTHGTRGHITTAPYIELKALGGMQFRVKFRVENDNSRPSMHPDADVVEIALKLGAPAPANPADGTTLVTSTKATKTEMVNIPSMEGQKLFMFARYKNIVDDTKSGPWSIIASVTLS